MRFTTEGMKFACVRKAYHSGYPPFGPRRARPRGGLVGSHAACVPRATSKCRRMLCRSPGRFASREISMSRVRQSGASWSSVRVSATRGLGAFDCMLGTGLVFTPGPVDLQVEFFRVLVVLVQHPQGHEAVVHPRDDARSSGIRPLDADRLVHQTIGVLPRIAPRLQDAKVIQVALHEGDQDIQHGAVPPWVGPWPAVVAAAVPGRECWVHHVWAVFLPSGARARARLTGGRTAPRTPCA